MWGISAFRDCVSLEQISVSEKIKDQPGITELEKNCPNARIRFREVNSVEKNKTAELFLVLLVLIVMSAEF